MFTLIQTIKNPENSSTVKETSKSMDKNAFLLIAHLIIFNQKRDNHTILKEAVNILKFRQFEAGYLLKEYNLNSTDLRLNLLNSFRRKETKIIYKEFNEEITTMEQLEDRYTSFLLPIISQNNPTMLAILNQTDPACPNSNPSQIADNELPPGLDDNQLFNFSPQALFEDDHLNQGLQLSDQNNLNFFPPLNQTDPTWSDLGNSPITNSDGLTFEQGDDELLQSFNEWLSEERIIQSPTLSKH